MNRPPAKQNPLLRWSAFLPSSFRARLVVGNILITFIAIVGMGYYVYYRAREANTYLTAQLEQSIRQKAEEKLANTIDKQATELDFFFHSKSEDVSYVGATMQRLLEQESSFNSGAYWDAQQFLFRLPNGSWDNENTETSSIFMPAAGELTAPLASELNALKYTETTVPLILQAHPEIIAIYFGGISGETIYYPNIDLANIVPPDFDVSQRPWFVEANPTQNPQKAVVWSDPYQDAALHGIVVTSSMPVFDGRGVFRGVAAMDIQLNIITDVVSNIHVGETGYGFLVDRNNRLIAFPQAGYDDFETSPEALPLGEQISQEKLANLPGDFFTILSKTSSGKSGLETIELGGVERFMVYRPIPEVGYGLVILVPTEEMLTEFQAASQQVALETRNTFRFSILLVGAILLVGSVSAAAISNTLSAPLKRLTKIAEEITGGNLQARADTSGRGEISVLGQTLNTMTSNISELIQSLEQRVAERTADLETARLLSERRVRELQTIGEISSIVASEQKIETLLPLVTRLVSERFDFYHVGIFLVDETKEFAVLMAANSEGGQKMLARGHKLRIGETGIVGYVTKYSEARIALDVGTDAVFFNNPDLPDTRSEMALPLTTRGQIIGVLDVQSNKPGAFTESDAQTLSILADQIATAIENARLFEQTQQALGEAQALYSQYIRESWGALSQTDSPVGYHQALTGGRKLSQPVASDEIREVMNRGRLMVLHAGGDEKEPAMVVPVKLRGQVIGVINIKAPTRDHHWSQDEVDLAEAISDRLSLALENARLFEETTRRAERERLVSDITTKIRGTNDPQDMIRTAVEELKRALGAATVEIIPQSSSLHSDEQQIG